MISIYSEAGIFHNARGSGNQDTAVSAENDRYTAIVLADGVSSCRRSGEGSRFIARAAADYLMDNCGGLFEQKSEWIREAVSEEIKERLAIYAYETDCDIADLSSTLAFVLADKKEHRAICFNLGDGLIISASPEKCRVEVQPDIIPGGCHVTTTEGFENVVRCSIIDTSDISTLAICSDGAWRALFHRNKMREDIRSAFMAGDMKYIFRFLGRCSLFDDHSIISFPPQDLSK